jgi:hypothetical protein
MTPKQEAESLMNAELHTAKEMLRQYGEFYPYGAYINLDSKIIDVGAKVPGTRHPQSKELLKLLRDSFKDLARKNQCKATAIIFDVTIPLPGTEEKSEAIKVCLDHFSNYSAIVFLPYRITNKKPMFGTAFAQEGTYEIFGRSP